MNLLAAWTPEEVRSVITLIGTTIGSILAAVAVVLVEWNRRTNKAANAELKADVQKVKGDLKENTEKTDLIAEESELQTDLIEAAGGNTASSRSRIKAAKMRHVRPKPLPRAEVIDDPKTEI